MQIFKTVLQLFLPLLITVLYDLPPISWGFYHQEDNYPKHSSNLCTVYLTKNKNAAQQTPLILIADTPV